MRSDWCRIGKILLIVGFLSLWGCSSKVNQDNYKKIKIGMSYEEVTAILGEPVTCESILGIQNCDWGDETRAINIKFAADNVVFRTAKGLS